ncbi:MAG: exodeoxyribonuclease V subunit gamma, partial [Ideonella sp.]
ATGDAPVFRGIAPYLEVGGLEASIAGSIADLASALLGWADRAATDATPVEWAARLRSLVDDFLAPTDDHERLSIAAFDAALRGWLEACDAAGFVETMPLDVAREACLSVIDEPSVRRRFRSGGVTFCTLLPMRSIPFEVVCLLGMNDGDYPRSTSRSDFDLMALPGQMRPGDRSRRDDDRQLMLEALLSARRVLYISWTGRSVRDNSLQPPSVLVSQLRDYLAAGWSGNVLDPRTTEHPLQPFSRRYFVAAVADQAADDTAPALFTHAREWRAAHADVEAVAVAPPSSAESQARVHGLDDDAPLTIALLARFLRNPVKAFFRNRLAVVFAEEREQAPDDEAFVVAGLQHYQLLDGVLKQVLDQAGLRRSAPDDAELAQLLAAPIEQLRLSGSLPMAGLGQREAQAMHHTLLVMLRCWYRQQALYLVELPKERLHVQFDGLAITDWLTGARIASPAPSAAGAARAIADAFKSSANAATSIARTATSDTGPRWLELTPTRLYPKSRLRIDKLVRPWITTLMASASGRPLGGILVGRDAVVTVEAMAPDLAEQTLQTLLHTWRDGMTAPLPLPIKTALSLLENKGRQDEVYDGGFQLRGEVQDDPCLARTFPDFEALSADGRFAELAHAVYQPLLDWVETQVKVVSHADLMVSSEVID